MMLRQGEVDGLVCGAAHITAATVRPALQILGTSPACRLVSSVFFMCLPDEVVVYADCAINPQPSADDLADIAIQSAASARAFGIEPRVAMISFSTGISGTGTNVDKVAHATRIVREREPGLAVDGPLQYDAAIASVGQAKRPGSPLAGQATVFIFPDLDTGNATYKAVQRSAQVVSIGPMLQGLAKPVNDLSRGALVDDIIYTVALTAIQARGGTRRNEPDRPATSGANAELYLGPWSLHRRAFGSHLLAYDGSDVGRGRKGAASMDSTTSCTSTRRPACCSLMRRSAWPRSSLRSSPWWPADRRVRPGTADGQTGGLGCELARRGRLRRHGRAAVLRPGRREIAGAGGARSEGHRGLHALPRARAVPRLRPPELGQARDVGRAQPGGTSTGAAPSGTQAERRVTGARGQRRGVVRRDAG